jgi:hypothetical protein
LVAPPPIGVPTVSAPPDWPAHSKGGAVADCFEPLCDPTARAIATFFGLLGEEHLSDEFAARIRNVENRGAYVHLTFKLRKQPTLGGAWSMLNDGQFDVTLGNGFSVQGAVGGNIYYEISNQPTIGPAPGVVGFGNDNKISNTVGNLLGVLDDHDRLRQGGIPERCRGTDPGTLSMDRT